MVLKMYMNFGKRIKPCIFAQALTKTLYNMYTLDTYKIKTPTEDYSRKVQMELYRLGYNWSINLNGNEFIHLPAKYLYANANGTITYCSSSLNFETKIIHKEITLNELKQLMSLAELIIGSMDEQTIEINAEQQFDLAVYDDFLIMFSNEYYLETKLNCQQQLVMMSGEEEQGLSAGYCVMDIEPVVIIEMDLKIYNKEDPDTEMNLPSAVKDVIKKEISNRLKFVL